MASGILRVTPEKLQATAASFEASASSVNSLTQNMTSVVTSLSGQIWSGEAATAYVNKFNGLQDDMNRIYKMIKEHSDDLTAIAQQIIGQENLNMDLANGLSSDVIV